MTEKGDRVFWKKLRVETVVDEVRPDGSFRIMEIFPEAYFWDAEGRDLVKLEPNAMSRIKIEPSEMMAYRNHQSDIRRWRQASLEAMHQYAWSQDGLALPALRAYIDGYIANLRTACQKSEVFLRGLEKKYGFDRTQSIVLDLWTDELGVQKEPGA